MANDENLKGHGFHERTAKEQREIASLGGKASGETRRKKADFRRTLNLLLTAKIDSPEWTPALEAFGLESTLESALNMAMIKAGLAGNVKAYEAVAKYAGQSSQTETVQKNQQADTELKQARKQAVTGERETDEALQKLDEILKGVRENAIKQETE